MQTVEDYGSGGSGDEESDDSAAMQRFVGGLSSAQQVPCLLCNH